jgi:hypothetical protein
MTIDEILTQVDSMRGLAKELSGDARVFVLKACVELLGEATRLLRIEARGAKALIPTDLASSPRAETVPPAPPLLEDRIGEILTCEACGQPMFGQAAKPNMVHGEQKGWLHAEACL